MENDYIKSTRDGFGKALAELGESNLDIVALCADVAESIRMDTFADKFPDRFFDMGVAEQNMVACAAGLSLEDKIPFAGSFACFLTTRALDQIRISVAYNNTNVKLVGSHGGLSTGADGATHQMLEDIAIMRALPNMAVIVPADGQEAYSATKALSEYVGPSYLRLARVDSEPINIGRNFIIGKAQLLLEGDDIVIISCGVMVHKSLKAAMRLRHEGINAAVINCHTIKPLDEEMILKTIQHTRGIVVAEDAQTIGGLGGAISELLGRKHPKPIRFVGVNNKFGESGEPDELYKKYHLDIRDIIKEGIKAFRRICD